MNFYDKMLPITFVNIDGKEINADELITTIEELLETREDDRYGEYSLRDYEVSYIKVMEVLVELGYAKNYIGSRMANLYCAKNTKKLEELRDKFWELYDIHKEVKKVE